jgi:hypothetical protein
MKQFHAAALMAAASLVATAMLLTSCGSDSTTVTNRLVPPAQEEADLKRALDAGAITQSEYEEQLDKLHSGN